MDLSILWVLSFVLRVAVLYLTLQHPRQQSQHVEIHHDEPNSFSRPKGLSYEIQNGGNNIFKGEDILKSNPVSEHDKLNRPATQAQQLTQEEYLAESLKECAPRGMQDIDET